MSLSFVLAGSQIKKFRSALRSLAAIGSELLVEGIPERLVLRSINSARSAFLAVTFSANFFDSYNVFGGTGLIQTGVLLKHILATFRTARVSSVSFELNLDDASLRVTLKCDNGLVKRYGLDVTDAEILQANLDGQDLPVSVVAEAAELNKLLNTFQSTLDEITIIAQPDQQPQDSTAAAMAAAQRAVRMQSFLDPAKGLSGQSLHTQLQLDSHSVFKSYSHSGGYASDITVNLKDLKALVGLCVEMGADVCLRFDAPGVPLLAVPHIRGVQEMDYTAELILATLQESQLEQDEQWGDDTTAAAGAAANGHAAAAASDGFNTRDQRQTTGAGSLDRPETIAPATTFAGGVGGVGGGARDAGETPQNRMNPLAAAAANRLDNTAANRLAGTAAGISGGVPAGRQSAAAVAGSGAGGRSRAAGSGLSRLQRLEADEEAGRLGRAAPYSRLNSSMGGGVSGAAGVSGGGISGGMASPTAAAAAAPGNNAAINNRGTWGQAGVGKEADGIAGVNHHQQQQQQPQSEYASRSLGEFARQQPQHHGVADMAVEDGTDSQMDPETLPGRRAVDVRQMVQQRMQATAQQQHQHQQQQQQGFGSEQLFEQQQLQKQQGNVDGDMGAQVEESEDELPQTPSQEQQEGGAGYGFL